MKRNFTLIIISLIIISAQSKSNDFLGQTNVTVGKEPTYIFYDSANQYFNIICNGYDANYNSAYDDGDEYPSWWRIKYNFYTLSSDIKPEKLRDFKFDFIGFPFRPAINDSVIFFTQDGYVKSYNIFTGNLIDSTLFQSYGTALTIDNNIIYSSEYYSTDSNLIKVFNISTKLITDSIHVAKNTIFILPYCNNNKKYLAVLSQGTFGTYDSKLEIFSTDSSYKLQNSFIIGNGANHLELSDNGLFAITLNGSHQVKILNINNFTDSSTIDIPTTGYNGPRESRFIKNNTQLLVTTYSGTFYIYDISDIKNAKLTNNYFIGEKSDGLCYQDTLNTISNPMILVANTLNMDYSPANNITLFANFSDCILESIQDRFVKIYPNPTNDMINIDFNDNSEYLYNDLHYEIYSEKGILIYGNELNHLSNLKISTKEINLNTGTYFIKITNNNHSQVLSFTVIK